MVKEMFYQSTPKTFKGHWFQKGVMFQEVLKKATQKTFKDISLLSKRCHVSGSVFQNIPKTFKDISLLSKWCHVSGSVFQNIPKTFKDISLLSKWCRVSGSVFQNIPKTFKDISLLSKRGHVSGSVFQNIPKPKKIQKIHLTYVTPRLSRHAGRSCQQVRSARPRGPI